MSYVLWYIVGAAFTFGTFEGSGGQEALGAALWPVVLPMRMGSAFRVLVYRGGGWR